MKPGKIIILLLIAIPFFLSFELNAQELYVGANYHPHDDKNIDKIKKDIDLMKDAGFTSVRMGHLAWIATNHRKGFSTLSGSIR